MMKNLPSRLIFGIFTAVLLLGAFGRVAVADEAGDFARQIAGTYVLSQGEGNVHSSYVFTDFGSVIWSAADQKEFSYAPGNGVWKQTAEHAAAVRIVSFELDDRSVAVIDMTFNFDEDFRSLSGSYEGGIYPPGVDVNVIDKKMTRKLSGSFTGVRLSIDN